MRPICIFLFSLFLVFSCKDKQKEVKHKKTEVDNQIQNTVFQSILDEYALEGTILIYDSQKNVYHSNDFARANTGILPASTFKIANSIIALETGVVKNDSTLFKWDGNPRAIPIWDQDLTLKKAFHFSCVPCYQDVARRIGSERMNSWLNKLQYGDIKVDSTNIEMFWLEGNSEISPLQQIDFLLRFYEKKLPISSTTQSIMSSMMIIEENEEYKLSGKTGWSIYQGINNGWFVGYLETEKGQHFFATNVEPKGEFNRDVFVKARKELVYKALKQMKIIN